MKTITNFLLALACVCLLSACSKSDDEIGGTTNRLKSDETRSIAFKTDLPWTCHVFCDGVEIDYLEGNAYGQVVIHYKDGDAQWEIINVKGTGTNLKGETFTFSEQNKVSVKTLPIVWTVHTNIKGDKGTLYNISFIYILDENWDLISWQVKNAVCTGNTN